MRTRDVRSDQATVSSVPAGNVTAPITRSWRTEDWIAVVLGFLVITSVLFQWKVFDRLHFSADYLSPITAMAEISSIMPTAGRLCTVMVVLAGKLPSGKNSWRIGISGSINRGSVR